MNTEFLDSLPKADNHLNKLFLGLHQGVVETNELIGLKREDLSYNEMRNLLETYEKLLTEEIKEVQGAIDNKDRSNLVQELVDVLVVGGFLLYLKNGKVYDNERVVDFTYNRVMESVLNKEVFDYEDVVFSSQCLLEMLDCNVEKVVNEVLQANLSKFPTYDELVTGLDKISGYGAVSTATVLEIQCKLLEGERYQGITSEAVVDSSGNTRYVFWCTYEYGVPKRKYLKPVTFKKADVSDIWFD